MQDTLSLHPLLNAYGTELFAANFITLVLPRFSAKLLVVHDLCTLNTTMTWTQIIKPFMRNNDTCFSVTITASDKVFILEWRPFMYIMYSNGTGTDPRETPYVDLRNTVCLWLLVSAHKSNCYSCYSVSCCIVHVNRLYNYIFTFITVTSCYFSSYKKHHPSIIK